MQNVAKCLSEKDRKALKVQTREEAELAYVAKSEKELQRKIESLLNRRGYRPIRQRMDRKSNIAEGMPDIQFSCYGQAVYWEIKLPGRNPDPAQKEQIAALLTAPNSAEVRVIRSYQEAFNHLQELERKYKPKQ
ncbi:hypothetical protein [Terrimicrobium sacchariphilum]|nr:hypothetical protein [Terrimicrobium sacchariphilum]